MNKHAGRVRTGALAVAALAATVVVLGGPTPSGAAPEASAVAAKAAAVPPEGARPIVVRGGTWFIRSSLSSGPATTTFAFGNAGDTPVSGDWDGNGSDTAGVVRGSTWLLRNANSAGGANYTFAYGRPSDVPIVGDWDGNGTFTPGIIRGATWHLRNSNSGGAADVSFTYGAAGDTFVAGDWDGNGTFTPGAFRAGRWGLRNSNSAGPSTLAFAYGQQPGDLPLVGDWDANGTTTPGVRRAGGWHLRDSNSTGNANHVFAYGRPCDVALSSESGLSRQWGGTPLRAGQAGTEMTQLPTTQRVVALTFDAGANANGVPSILNTLRSQCIPATFFLTGEFTRDFPAVTRDIGREFPIGNHTDTHPSLPSLPDAQVRSQISVTQSAIHDATRYDPRPMFRFPFGESDARTLGIVNSMGYTSLRWTVDTAGWRGTSGGASIDTIMQRVLGSERPGQIILMHVGSHPQDGSTLDADALPRIISELRARGYSFTYLTPYV
jgi:peptidoglycan/xylan/chitin deacetylase (PgdA/CDA1 family)